MPDLTREEILELVQLGESLCELDLAGIDLSGLDLTGADFEGANLEGADLSGADLTGANFSCANLQRVRFQGAVVRWIQWKDSERRLADFSKAVWL